MTVTVLTPENLKLDEIVQKNPPQYQPFNLDKLKMILSIIIEQRLKVISITKKIIKDHEVPVHSHKMYDYVHNYKQYINYLIQNKIIYTDNSYKPDEFSKNYSLTTEYRNKELVSEVISDYTLIKREKKLQKRINTKRRYLDKWFNSKLEIDVNGAINEAKRIKYNQKDNIDNKNNKMKLTAEEYYAITLNSITKIHNQRYNLSIDNTSKRYHSNLTQLKSNFRKYITYNNKKLIEIDIKTSQPYLSIIPLNYYLNTQYNTSNKLIQIIHQFYDKIIDYNLPIMLSESSGMIDRRAIDFYIKLIKEGEFYEYLRKAANKKGYSFRNKSELKDEMIFPIFFSINYFNSKRVEHLKNIFKDVFFNVHEVFRLLKEDRYERLSHLLQRLESYLVLDVCAKKISKEHPSIPLFTIHDSIITTEGNEKIVHEIMYNELLNYVGVEPQLHVKNWE